MTVYAISEPLSVASAKALRAHHALGCLATCSSATEFEEKTKEFLALARAVSLAIARIRDESASPAHAHRHAFKEWLAVQVSNLQRHPFETLAILALPSVYVARLARGSGPPPFEGVAIARIPPMQRASEFFYEGLDTRPALELCAEYLDRVTSLLDETREQLRGLGHGDQEP